MTTRWQTSLLLAAALLVAAPAARAQERDFKTLIEDGDYRALGKKLEKYLELNKADPKLRRYLELNLEYLARGARPASPDSELILFRGAKNDQVYRMPASSGGDALMLPNSIRYQRKKWDARLPRLDGYFREATTLMGGDGDALRELDKIISHHKGGGLGKGANSTKSVLISTSTRPISHFGPPYYLLKVAPERAIFNVHGLSSEYEVLIPFWILPHEIVGKFDTLEELKQHPLYQESKLKSLEQRSWGYGAGGSADNWAIIEENIRKGRPPLQGLAGLNSYFPEAGRALGPVADAEYVERFSAKVASHGGSIEWVEPGDLRLPEGAQARTILGEDGRPRVLLRAGEPPRRVALVDELTHVLQLERMIAARGSAEVESLLLRARLGDPTARDVVNRWEIRAKQLVRSMTPDSDPMRAELTRSIEVLEAELDPYARSRRADGTIDWRRARELGTRLGGGVAHFTLALFLKELAVVARTGDSLRMEEFFDGLLTTDFYVHYGLFSLGAAGADAAYARFMERHVARFVRPQFVRSILRSNLSLAVGMALPQLMSGQFSAKAFAIDVAGLGLSATAVKAGAEALKWVFDMRRVPGGATLATRLAGAKRLMRVGGWVYTAFETAVVLYFGDQISQAIDEALARREAEGRVRAAMEAVLADPTGEGARERLDALAEAYRAYRDVLARPFDEAEALLMTRLQRIGLDVKKSDDGLRRLQGGDYGDGLGAAARRLAERREAEHAAEVQRAIEAYERAVQSGLREVYGQPGAEADREAIADRVGDAFEPAGGDWLTRMGRRIDAARNRRAASDLPTTRLEAYDHEASLYEAIARELNARDPAAAVEYEARAAFTRDIAERDYRIATGAGRGTGADAEATVRDETASGLLDALEGAFPEGE